MMNEFELSQPEPRLPEMTLIDAKLGVSWYLVENLIPESIRQIDKHQMIIVDYGSGTSTMTQMIARHSATLFPQKFVQVIGYDPQIDPVSRAQNPSTLGHLIGLNTPGLPERLIFTDKLPQQADIVNCHFSLHHSDDVEMTLINSIGKQLQPQKILISEFDFSNKNPWARQPSLDQFLAMFQLTEAGRLELSDFEKNYQFDRERADTECYQYHQRYSIYDYLHALDSADYEAKSLVQKESEPDSYEKYKFLLEAERKY